MSGLKEIRRRISSVKSTKQITRAMKLVSAAKLRRAQDGAVNGRGYSEHLQRIFRNLLVDVPEDFSHPLLEKPLEVKKRRVIVVSGERGLCGAYNANVIKAIVARETEEGVEVDFVPIGRRAVATAKHLGWKVAAEYESLPEDVALWPVDQMIEKIFSAVEENEADEVVVYYTKFVTAMTQNVTREVLIPFSLDGLAGTSDDETPAPFKGHLGSSPDPAEIISKLIPLYVKTKVRQAGLESKASEHAARMTAMDAASRNADDLIDKLTLFYNRARQSTITKELLDIVGGAEALNG